MILRRSFRREKWSPVSWSLLWCMTATNNNLWVPFPSGVSAFLRVPHPSVRRLSHRCYSAATTEKEQQEEAKDRNYIFGYGSLMCPESRRVTNANLAQTSVATSVLIQDWERNWCARTTTGYTAVGVVPSAVKRSCMGMLLGAIQAKELVDVDRREASYDRCSIPLSQVQMVSFTETAPLNENQPIASFLLDNPDIKTNNNADDIKVWVYVPKHPIPPDASHPIVQSYVDIILRGCLETGGPSMARSFIQTTTGWFSTTSLVSGHWVDDRATPIYKRADYEYSQRNAANIDQLLFAELERMGQGNTQAHRQQYDPIRHLEHLEQALEQKLAHPSALQHVHDCLQNVKT